MNRKWKYLFGIALAFTWCTILFVLLKTNGNLTVETLVHFRPKNIPLTLLVLLCMFLLKSMDFLLTTGILFAAVGVMFPLPAAIFINLIGAGIILLVPYMAGKQFGAPLVQRLLPRYHKLSILHKLQNQHQFLLAILIRVAGIPINVGSLYMSAAGFGGIPFFAGSFLGWLPSLLCYTVIGTGLQGTSSSVLWTAAGAQLLLCICALYIYRLIQKNHAS